MKPFSHELADALAQRYVMGTLRGMARQRFTTLIRYQPLLRQRVQYWQNLTMPLLEALPPRPPREQVWHGVQQRLFNPVVQTRPGLFLRWKPFLAGALMTALASVLFITVHPFPSPSAPQNYGALLAINPSASWWIGISQDHLNLHPITPYPVDDQHDLQLWLLPAHGTPISLGLVNRQDTHLSLPLSKPLRESLAQSNGVALSLEPRGGSPTGLPTGPILTHTKIFPI